MNLYLYLIFAAVASWRPWRGHMRHRGRGSDQTDSGYLRRPERGQHKFSVRAHRALHVLLLGSEGKTWRLFPGGHEDRDAAGRRGGSWRNRGEDDVSVYLRPGSGQEPGGGGAGRVSAGHHLRHSGIYPEEGQDQDSSCHQRRGLRHDRAGSGDYVLFFGHRGGPINLVVLFFFFSMDTKTAAQNSLYIILFSQIASLLNTLATRTVPEFAVSLLVLMVACGILGGANGKNCQQAHGRSHGK